MAAAERVLAGDVRPTSVLLAPGRLDVELAGPAEDVRAPDGFALLCEPPAEPRGAGLVQVGVPPPQVGALARYLERAGLPYEAQMGVGVCRVAVESVEDIVHLRSLEFVLAGHAVVVDGPDELRADPWGPDPPGIHLMKRLREAFDPAGTLNPQMLVWA